MVSAKVQMAAGTQIRACQVGACSDRVPANLVQEGVCLGHYLDQAFARVSAALELRRRDKPLDARTLQWLQQQGDFAVRLLSNRSSNHTAEQRARLLELLLCLANVQEYNTAAPGPKTW
jgi:hypothetical protein